MDVPIHWGIQLFTASIQKTTADAFIDVTMSGSTLLATVAASTKVGAMLGTTAPGVGTVVGAGAGIVVGVFIYGVTDGIKIQGKSIREHVKAGFSFLLGIKK